MRQLRRQALRLSPGAVPAMIDVLAHGSDAEVKGAFNVLYQHGVRIDREGYSPQSCRYRVTLPDGSVHTVRPDNLGAEDFEEDLPPSNAGPSMDTRDLAKSWRSEAILALVTAGMIGGALKTTGMARLALTVLAVCTGALLVWSLIILMMTTTVIAVVAQHRDGRPDEDNSE
jgi:hypothetical protein